MNNLVVEIKTKKLNLQKRAEKTEQVCDCGLSRVNMLYTRKRKKGGEKKKKPVHSESRYLAKENG